MRLAVALVTMVAAGPVSAWDGADDPAFAQARAAWLGGADDMGVMGALAPLAASGNRAAQVMLGTLVAEGRVPAAVGALPRAERIALTRAPGGLSGTSWLTVAAGADPVAAALEVAGVRWQQATQDQQVAALQTLLAAGEAGAAQRILANFTNMGGWGPDGLWTRVLDHAGHPALQGHGVPLLLMVQDVATRAEGGATNPEGAARAAAALAGAHPADLALAVATGGRPGFVTLSPFEGLVSSADYQASPRFAADLRAALGRAAPVIAGIDSCAAVAVGGG